MKANITIDSSKKAGEIDRKIFGHFMEHAFGNIYGGVYDPESRFADEDGFRTDVIELLKEVKVPVLRYPGGNFVSSYHWEDGIGPKENRPKKFDFAWGASESNQFGTADFIKLCRKTGAEPLICVNMGSGTAEEAMNWVEYCNGTQDTYYANLRRSHGYEEPFQVKYWGLGNEMYGVWQMESMTAEEYAGSAAQFAKAMKKVDENIHLVACGMEQDAEWNHTVVKKLEPYIDMISAHYYGMGWEEFGDISEQYEQTLYIPYQMEERHKLTLASIITGQNGIKDNIKVAWDEWNMFGWSFDAVNEDSTYNLHDAIITALILNMILRNCDTIKMAMYSTFVNITGALSVTKEGCLKRTQYHVFDMLSNHTGSQLIRTDVDCSSSITIHDIGHLSFGANIDNKNNHASGKIVDKDIPAIDAVATMDSKNIYVSVVNQSLNEDCELFLDIHAQNIGSTMEKTELYGDSILDANTFDDPDHICPHKSTQDVNQPVIIRKHSVNVITIPRV